MLTDETYETRLAAAEESLRRGATTRAVREQTRISQGKLTELRRNIGLPPGPGTGVTKRHRRRATFAARAKEMRRLLDRGWSVRRANRSLRRRLGAGITSHVAYRMMRQERGVPVKNKNAEKVFRTSQLPPEPAARLEALGELVRRGDVTPRQGRKLMDFPDLMATKNIVVLPADARIVSALIDAKRSFSFDGHGIVIGD